MTSTFDDVPAKRAKRRSTRASFLKAGAGGLLTVSAGAGLTRQLDSSARAESGALKIELVINEGYVRMTDGSSAFMRGFGVARDGSPMVPGPPIGHDAAAVLPGEVAFVKAGEPVLLVIRNALTGIHANEEHFFTIDGASDRFGTPLVEAVPIDPSGAATYIPFNAPEQPGTYLYMDDDPIQRLLGLHGVMVVMPADDSRRPYLPTRGLLEPPYFDEQFVWVFHDVDPVWGELARNGVFRPDRPPPISQPSCLPRYFTINGVSGKQSDESLFNSMRRFVVPEGQRGQGTLIRIVNAGAASHAPHFHGNHVYVLTENRQLPHVGGLPALSSLGEAGVPFALEKDVVRMQSLGCTDVLLPFHEPLDQWPPYSRAESHHYRYPMHCHAEMSQSAGGGQYPSGMYTEWHLKGDLGPEPHVGG